MLQHAFQTCAPFRRFLSVRHRLTTSSADNPWRLIIYADEYNPGLELDARHARKQWMLYATFVEYGAYALEREVMWWPIGAALTSDIDMVESGFSQYAGRVIQSLFCGLHDPRLGIMLDANGQYLELFYRFEGWLLDGLASKLAFGTKGDNGTRLCVKCINCYSEKSTLADAPYDGLVVCLHDRRRLVFATDEQIHAIGSHTGGTH